MVGRRGYYAAVTGRPEAVYVGVLKIISAGRTVGISDRSTTIRVATAAGPKTVLAALATATNAPRVRVASAAPSPTRPNA